VVPSPKPRNVLFDHDGGVDDLLSLMMLLAMPHINLIGIVVTPADCFLRPAVSASLKVLRFFGRLDIELSEGSLHGINPFPRDWRKHAYAIDALPILNELPQPDAYRRQGSSNDEAVGSLPAPVPEPGHEFLIRKLREAVDPVTVLITGPVANLAAALIAQPDLADKIETVVWMGGALNVPGNVRDYDHDGTAEWNAFWDPVATDQLWQSAVPITLFSLDATNRVPVTMAFLHRLARQRRYPLSDLAGQCWALTVGIIPSYEYVYHMWDTLTTGYLGAPQFITFRQVRSEVVPNGPSAGRTKEVKQGGRVVQAAENVDVDGFQNYILELLRR